MFQSKPDLKLSKLLEDGIILFMSHYILSFYFAYIAYFMFVYFFMFACLFTFVDSMTFVIADNNIRRCEISSILFTQRTQ